jgi:ParB/RepB/Spo0J family partition protein
MSKRAKEPRGVAGLVGKRAAETHVSSETLDAVLRRPSSTRSVPISQVGRSPFQPASRPSLATLKAVRDAIVEAGSLAVLLGRDGSTAADQGQDSPLFVTLTDDARELALLAADIAANGIDTPLEVRAVPGAVPYQLLSGHRRLAAAALAGLADVRITEVTVTGDDEAATIVFRRNRLREDFTAWEEARSLAELQRRRNAARKARGEGAEPVREFAKAMGYSAGRISELLRIARTWLPMLRQINPRAPDEVEVVLSRLPYTWMRDKSAAYEKALKQEIPKHDRDTELLEATRLRAGLVKDRGHSMDRVSGLPDHPDTPHEARAAWTLTPPTRPIDRARFPQRRGAPVLTVTIQRPIEEFRPSEARHLLATLEDRLLKALRAKMKEK